MAALREMSEIEAADWRRPGDPLPSELPTLAGQSSPSTATLAIFRVFALAPSPRPTISPPHD